MMDIKIDERARKAVISIKNLDRATRRGLRQGFFQYGAELKKVASRQVLQKPKGGRLYIVRRGKTRRRHRASAPGESPANLSGEYRRSIGYQVKGATQMVFGAGSKKVPYAKWLEEGTKRMKPRPGLGNALKETYRDGQDYLSNGIKKHIQK